MKNIIRFIIIGIFASGCFYSQPRNKKFPFYQKNRETNIVRTDGVYYNNFIDFKKMEISQTLIRFYDDFSVQAVTYNAVDTLLSDAIEVFNRAKKKSTKVDKGFYYIDGDVLKFQILYGFGYLGYHFLYYEGKFNANNELIIDYKGSKPYKNAKYKNSLRESSPFPKKMKFYKTE